MEDETIFSTSSLVLHSSIWKKIEQKRRVRKIQENERLEEYTRYL